MLRNACLVSSVVTAMQRNERVLRCPYVLFAPLPQCDYGALLRLGDIENQFARSWSGHLKENQREERP